MNFTTWSLVRPTPVRLAAVLAAGVCADAASGEPKITNLGVLPGWTASYGNAISADGSTVVGEVTTGNEQQRAFRWTAAGGMELLASLSLGWSSKARAVSADGSVAAGYEFIWLAPYNRAVRWTAGGGIQDLGLLPGGIGGAGAAGVSADGTMVTGDSASPVGTLAFRWTAGGGMRDLNAPPYVPQFVYANNADGSVVVGQTNFVLITGDEPLTAFRWKAGVGMQNLGSFLPPGKSSAAVAVNSDGSVVVCNVLEASFPTYIASAFRWSASGGMQGLGTLPGATYASGQGVSHDGSMVVGESGGRAWLWTPSIRMVDLNVYLPRLGINLTGWILESAKGVSADKSSITGFGTFNGERRAFLVTGIVDSDGDGLLDDWETNGVPYVDNQGQIARYMLPDASPWRKDIYVEVDAMAGRAPSQATLNPVVAAFNATTAAVPAPPGVAGGVAGITLHVDLDETALFLTNGGNYDAKFVDFKQDKDAHFGTCSERADAANWPKKREAKARVYRYCIFANSHSGGTSSGLAKTPGNDFMVTLGLWDQPGGTPDQQAGTFMHELGHTLGLEHGGDQGDDPGNPRRYNFKPNYFSVMNYMWQSPRPWMQPGNGPAQWSRYFPNYSYSPGFPSGALPNLNEAFLSEATGIQGDHPEVWVPFSIPSGTMNCDSHALCLSLPSQPCTRYAKFRGPVDWYNNDCQPSNPSSGPLDINTTDQSSRPSPGDILTGFNDWANLQYEFKHLSWFADGVEPPTYPVELDLATEHYLNSLAPPPLECPADINGDLAIDTNDLLVLLGFFGQSVPIGQWGDINDDATVNTEDLILLLQRFGQYCS